MPPAEPQALKVGTASIDFPIAVPRRFRPFEAAYFARLRRLIGFDGVRVLSGLGIGGIVRLGTHPRNMTRAPDRLNRVAFRIGMHYCRNDARDTTFARATPFPAK
jgi:hypothetical protein